MNIELIGLNKIPLIENGDHIPTIILESIEKQKNTIENGDIILIAETIISKADGNFTDINSIKISTKAEEIAKKTGKDPKIVELILQESEEIIAVGPDFIISETKHGFVCANAGIDESNVKDNLAKPLPENPDKSAKEIREYIEKKINKEIAIIITDTQGRAFRNGAVGVAIGTSGIDSLWSRQGEKDLYGRELQTTEIGIADELASTASILMGQANEGIPVVIVRGFPAFQTIRNTSNGAKTLLRPKKFDIFRP